MCRNALSFFASLCLIAISHAAAMSNENSLGMKMVLIEPGSFTMGSREGGDFDERPVHRVTLSKPLFVGATEVTNVQYEQFDPAHKRLRGKLGFSKEDDEAVVFVRWHDAVKFCAWLTKKEGKPYRLPTEAEWEYACRAGTKGLYFTGDKLPQEFHKNVTTSWFPDPNRGRDKPVTLHVGQTPSSPWGLYDMHGNVEEWCLDWYGPYVEREQTDPVGRADGDFRVTRGGSHSTTLAYLRSANRAGTLPTDKSWLIGFRVVQGEMPKTKPLPVVLPALNARDVKQGLPADLAKGPDPSRPYFKGPTQYVTVPSRDDCPVYNRHNHCPAIVNCPNGDLLAAWYTCATEPGRELGIVAARLRFGEDQWQAASNFWDAPDRNDHATALWVDEKGTIYHFNGLSVAATWGNLATIMRTSTDNGATWSKARLIMPEHGLHHMPVESVIRTQEGALVVPCDAVVGGAGGTAVLVSRDDGKTWVDPGAGRPPPRFAAGAKVAWIAGIHAGLTQLHGGRLIAFGRGDNIDGRMPMSVSDDLGQNWTCSASPFPGISGGQRLAILRLAEGPILFCSFAREVRFRDAAGKEQVGSGLFAALSNDEGQSWEIKRLITDDGPPRRVDGGGNTGEFTMSSRSAEPRAYLSICQAADGVIHLISSKQHYAFNLTWLKTSAKSLPAGSLEDLQRVEKWEHPANGIWKATVGDMQGELRYTDLAADEPRIATINQLSQAPFPFEKGALQTMITADHKIVVRVPCDKDEKLYGFGLQLDGVKKSRQVMTLNVDHWKKGGGRTHAPVPFYISSKGYGVFFNTARFLKVYNQVGNRKDSPHNPQEVDRNPTADERQRQPGPWLALPPGDAVEAQINGKGLEIIVLSGNSMLEVVQRYNLYNGGGALPPLWGLGFWHRVHAHFNADQCRKEVAEFEKRDFPLEVLGLEPGWQSKSYPCTFEWQKQRFADPAAFTRELLDQGVRLNLWENPYISKHSRLYKRMVPLSGSHLVWLGIVPDYTLPAARKLLTDQHHEDHISIGISGYKIDEVDGYDHWLWPDHATFPSGISGETMRQAYGLIMQKMLYQDLFKNRNVRTYGLVRASNGAASGYPFVLYSDAYSHAEYITGLSTASLSGLLWTPEVRSARDGREWLNRMQTVCFSPLAQLNAWSSGKKPWSYADVNDPVRDVIKLRMRLLPYLYSAFADYHFKGIPPIRAMILEDGFREENTQVVEGNLDSEKNPYAMGTIIEKADQFMFGSAIMVAPFYERQASKRSVRLPARNWYDFYSGEFVGNNKTITITAAELKNRIPLFVKEGAVIPMLSEAVKNSKEAYGHPLEVRHYGAKAGVFRLYEDDGKTFDYEKGHYRIRQLRVDEHGKLSVKIITDNAPALFGEVKVVKEMSR